MHDAIFKTTDTISGYCKWTDYTDIHNVYDNIGQILLHAMNFQVNFCVNWFWKSALQNLNLNELLGHYVD